MLNDNWVFQRAHQRPVGRYQVLGERSSGTNYLSALLRLNTLAEPTTDYGWKHGFIQFQAVLRTDLLVVVVREPLSWLRSMYNKPWHVPDAQVNVTFAEFLRQPWQTVVDMPGTMKAPAPRARGLPAQLDRHPLTGRPFDNVIQLRTQKLTAFLGIANRQCNVCFANYEAVAKEPRRFVAELGASYDIGLRPPWREPKRRLGDMPRPITGNRREAEARLSDADRAFVLSEADAALEAALGYDLAALLAKDAAAAAPSRSRPATVVSTAEGS